MTRQELLQGINKTATCWLWTGSIDANGYGRVWRQRNWGYVHRIIFTLFKGPILDGLYVCHSCNVKSCTRPSHLYLATPLQNTRDAARDGLLRAPRGSAQGSARLTDSKVRAIRASSLTGRALGEKYGVAQQHISKIKRGVLWAHTMEAK